MTEARILARVEALINGAPATPRPRELRILHACVRAARRRLRLPHRFVVHWRVYDAGLMARGACDAESIFLALEPRTHEEQLAGTIFHECKHLRDHHVGRPFDRAAWERDADDFSRQMLANCPALVRRQA